MMLLNKLGRGGGGFKEMQNVPKNASSAYVHTVLSSSLIAAIFGGNDRLARKVDGGIHSA